MKYLIISDLHSNTEALDAVLADAFRRGYDRAACMGDLVGYGAEPNAVVERVASKNVRMVRMIFPLNPR